MVDIDWDIVPPTTMPPGLNCAVKGFANEDAARRLGELVLGCVQMVGSFIDLSTLDGVTIAIDYDAALAELDRGLEGLRPLSRSNSEEMQGVAMSPAVMREGSVLTHLVFDAAHLVALIVDEEEQAARDLAIGIIAHECAHVQITAQKERAIPDARFGTAIEGYEHAVMFQMAEVCWDEYAACRLSAPFASTQNEHHSVTLAGTLEAVRSRSDERIKSYRLHGDINVLVAETGALLCGPMKAAAYLLGGMDAVEANWSEFTPVRDAIDDAGYADLIDDLHKLLRQLWDAQGSWDPTLDTFAPLEALAKRVFSSGGIHFETAGDGRCNIKVPFTASTMPTS